jgi:hypothetical protein
MPRRAQSQMDRARVKIYGGPAELAEGQQSYYGLCMNAVML